VFNSQTNRIKNLSKDQYEIIRELCRYSKNLYNVALYNLRQHFFETGKLLSYADNCKLCKTNENFKLIQAGVAQQIIRITTQGFKSFLTLKLLSEQGKYPSDKVKIPKYLKKKSFFQLVCSTNAISIKQNCFILPLSNAFKKLHPEAKAIRIPMPKRINNIREVRFHPSFNARFFEVEFVCLTEEVKPDLDVNKILGMDQGVDNFMACVTNTGKSFLLDGKVIKSANQWYNKERARLQSIKDLHEIKDDTAKMCRIAFNRNNLMQDYMRKAARYIVDYCLYKRIGTIVIGCNDGQKQNVNIGHVNNQNFVQIPFWRFRRILKSLCERYGIQYIQTEESYTSKASFLDRDILPIYGDGTTPSFSGKRISRGLYRSRDGKIVNADLNGAANIIRKVYLGIDFSMLDKAIMLNPSRVKVLATVKKKLIDLKSKVAA
jgi:IS605 OrfB family transposase